MLYKINGSLMLEIVYKKNAITLMSNPNWSNANLKEATVMEESDTNGSDIYCLEAAVSLVVVSVASKGSWKRMKLTKVSYPATGVLISGVDDQKIKKTIVTEVLNTGSYSNHFLEAAVVLVLLLEETGLMQVSDPGNINGNSELGNSSRVISKMSRMVEVLDPGDSSENSMKSIGILMSISNINNGYSMDDGITVLNDQTL